MIDAVESYERCSIQRKGMVLTMKFRTIKQLDLLRAACGELQPSHILGVPENASLFPTPVYVE